VRGVVHEVSPGTVNHVTCYCDDCQTYAAFLGTDGIVDAWGGTDIVQVGPARMRIVEGSDSLRCVRLSPKGLFRFYAPCCRVPVGNSLPNMPFVGVSRALLAVEPSASDAWLGPAPGIQGRFAHGAAPSTVSAKISPAVAARTVARLATWYLVARRPSPLFDERGQPIVTPEVLTKDRREALRAKAMAG
jgi:hypothetical protein